MKLLILKMWSAGKLLKDGYIVSVWFKTGDAFSLNSPNHACQLYFYYQLVTFVPYQFMIVLRELHLLLLMLTNCWLSLTIQTLSVPQCWLLPVLISGIRLVLLQKWKGLGLCNWPVVRKSHKLARYQPWKPCLIWSGTCQSKEALKENVVVSLQRQNLHSFQPVAVQTLSRVMSCFTRYRRQICISKKNGTAGSQISKSQHEALAKKVNAYPQGKNCHVIKKLSCKWKLTCAIAWETMIFIIAALCDVTQTTKEL